LEAQSEDRGVGWDMLSFANDPNQYATHPNWSHDGTTIVYTSMAEPGASVAEGTGADLYTVAFGSRHGGTASPLPGATTPHVNEYYPSFSPDDRYIAFTRALGPYDALSPDLLGTPANIDSNPAAEIFVVPRAGGAPLRLAANDPPACSGTRSPGVSNSWTSWSSQAQTVGDKTYYWITFSSRRIKSDTPQLYVSAMVVDASGQIQSYPALYLWNQPENEHNHTPVWDAFELPFPPIN
jgi:dipeptidyl aminopeptidase/acylaminoacyl peptidase